MNPIIIFLGQVYGLYMAYNLILFIFYFAFLVVPNKYLFRRPAMAVLSMFVRNPDSAAVSHTTGSNTRKVALKVLSVMELTPEDIENFYSEATVLAALQHENIVRCE
eukprot:gene33909-43808_t